jgi:hypothetical protein
MKKVKATEKSAGTHNRIRVRENEETRAKRTKTESDEIE